KSILQILCIAIADTPGGIGRRLAAHSNAFTGNEEKDGSSSSGWAKQPVPVRPRSRWREAGAGTLRGPAGGAGAAGLIWRTRMLLSRIGPPFTTDWNTKSSGLHSHLEGLQPPDACDHRLIDCDRRIAGVTLGAPHSPRQ